jgi:hypothetical protein
LEEGSGAADGTLLHAGQVQLKRYNKRHAVRIPLFLNLPESGNDRRLNAVVEQRARAQILIP